jgi:hypothetical protein
VKTKNKKCFILGKPFRLVIAALAIVLFITQSIFSNSVIFLKLPSDRQEVYQDSTVQMIKDSVHIMLSFESGFENTLIKISDITGNVLLNEALTTIPQLSLAKKIFIKKVSFPVKISMGKSVYILKDISSKFIYLKKDGTVLEISYSSKLKRYE